MIWLDFQKINTNMNFQSELTKYKRNPTGEKPFSCDLCKKSFSHNNGLTRHKKFTQVKNHTVVTNVKRHLKQAVNWLPTKGFTQVKSRSHVISVKSFSLKKAIWLSIKEFTRVRNHNLVISVKGLSLIKVP